MNVFIRGTIATGAHVLHEKIKQDMKAGAGEFVTEWRFAEVGEKEFMAVSYTHLTLPTTSAV